MYRDYRVPAELKPRAHHEDADRIGWAQILEHWALVVLDFSEIHQIVLETTDLGWPAIRDRIVGLISHPASRLGAVLAPSPT